MSLFSETFERATGIKLPDLRGGSSVFGNVLGGTDYFKGLKIPSLKINTEQFKNINVPQINTEQDFRDIKINVPDLNIPDLNMPTMPDMSLNLDQDLSKISVKGLQEEAVKRGGQIQNELIEIGSAGQQALIDAGAAVQAQAVRAGAAMQENAVQFGTDVSGGQSNPTLEGYANQITKGTESQFAQATKYAEEKVIPFAGDVAATAYGDKNPAVQIRNTLVEIAEDNTGGFEALPTDIANFFDPPKPESTPPQITEGDGLDPIELPKIGDEEVFPEIEGSTTKADKLTEEERQRRIRRLMLNRYGREDTILTGARDTKNRRRYASAL
jgi:hypothetical protein